MTLKSICYQVCLFVCFLVTSYYPERKYTVSGFRQWFIQNLHWAFKVTLHISGDFPIHFFQFLMSKSLTLTHPTCFLKSSLFLPHSAPHPPLPHHPPQSTSIMTLVVLQCFSYLPPQINDDFLQQRLLADNPNIHSSFVTELQAK